MIEISEDSRIIPAFGYDELGRSDSASYWPAWRGPTFADHGLGWWIGEFDGHLVIGNYSAVTGSQSVPGSFPEDCFTVVAMVNAYKSETGTVQTIDIDSGTTELLIATSWNN